MRKTNSTSRFNSVPEKSKKIISRFDSKQEKKKTTSRFESVHAKSKKYFTFQ